MKNPKCVIEEIVSTWKVTKDMVEDPGLKDLLAVIKTVLKS